MLTDVSTAIKATLYERAKKPFTGAFALSWCIINWKIIATLLFVSENNLKGKTRIEFIEENYLNWNDNFWIPIIVSIVLILLLPILNLAALYIKNYFKKVEFKNILKKQPIDASQYADILDEKNKLQENFTRKIKSMNDLSKKNTQDIVELNKRINDYENLESELEKYTDKYNKAYDLSRNYTTIIKEYRMVVEGYRSEFGEPNLKNIRELKDKLNKFRIPLTATIKKL